MTHSFSLSHAHTAHSQAITHYEQAADYYKGEDSTGYVYTSTTHTCVCVHAALTCA